MTAHERFDVLVVGAGPAGSSAARAAAEGGAEVLMVDRRGEVGHPVQCAEFLHRRVVMELGVPQGAISQVVDGMVTFISGEEAARQRSPGCILNREVLDQVMASRAEDAGVELRTRTLAVGPVAHDRGRVSIGLRGLDGRGGRRRVDASVIVGADGPDSTVGASVGCRNTRSITALQRTVVLNEPSSETEVHLRPDIVGGYAWLFPKGDRANVGVGVSQGSDEGMMAALDGFIDGLGGRVGEVVRSTGGSIPVGGPLRTVHGNVVLAGDAAGHAHPITGGGIHQAIVCGHLAGEAAASFVAGDGEAMAAYEPAWRDLFGPTLDHALRRRLEMEGSWAEAAADPGRFEALMRRCWIGFREYHKERG